MNPNDRERVKDLLAQAARLEPSRRRAYVESAAGGNAEITAEALELLHTLDDSGFLNAPTGAGFALPAVQTIPGENVGATIGRYKLLQLIGEGGFGSVFMAEQTEPVRRRVALKIIKAGMDTKQVIARFEAERQALALMDHPNIARVLDGGATENGRPYFVMELVRGDPVTQYCDREQLSVGQRLDLFRDVCGAVQHAHQKGIIHRDIKPSNVLVTVADGAPLPKVIDFGIAKATETRLTDKTLFTEMHQLIGTPEYMSPEQAEIAGVDIDTRSDIYALGVLLYELLVGSTPLERERLRSTPLMEIQRLIREEEPPRPSLRLATRGSSGARFSTPPVAGEPAGSSAFEIARRRQLEPLQLTRTLRRDLDWIVMKCLEKDRGRRYTTAIALSDDLGRYLADQPVLATPPGRAYKLRKFASRNKVWIGAAAAIAFALLVGTIISALGFWRATQAQRLAVLRSEESSREAAKAQAVNNFLQEMLSSANPEKSLGREVTIRQAVDDAAAKIDAGALKDQPGVQADLRFTIGSTYFSLGLYPEADRYLRSALKNHKELLGDTSMAVAMDLDVLANVMSAQGRFAEQEACMRECLGILKRLHPEDHPELAGAEQDLGAALRTQGKFAEAETHYRAGLEMRRRLFGPEHELVAQSLNSLALLAQNRRDFVNAERLFREALDIHRKLLGTPHPVVADALNNLGGLYHELARYDDAESLLRESLEMRRKLFGSEHPAVAQALNNLGNVIYDRKIDPALAEPLYREALAIWRKTLPADHLNIAIALDELSTTIMQESPSEAETLTRESLAIRQAKLPPNDQHVLTCTANLGEALAEQGKFEEAEPLLLKAYEGLKGKPDKLPRKEVVMRLVRLYELRNKPNEAAKWRTELSQEPAATAP